MRGKLVVTFLAGLVIGLVVAAAGWRQQALAQQPEKPRWEYKVEALSTNAVYASTRLNQLADEGWEYVGLTATSVPAPSTSAHESLVAFRRPKK
jgi:hypothetical protein